MMTLNERDDDSQQYLSNMTSQMITNNNYRIGSAGLNSLNHTANMTFDDRLSTNGNQNQMAVDLKITGRGNTNAFNSGNKNTHQNKR